MDRGALDFTGGGGMGFNSSNMSSFSVTRGASVGAAFDNSAKRFNRFFNMSRHHFREEKSVISSGTHLSRTSGGERRSLPCQKGPTLYQASFSKSNPLQDTTRAPSSSNNKAGTPAPGGVDGVEQVSLQAGGGVFARSFHASHMHKGTPSWQQQTPRQRHASGGLGDATSQLDGRSVHARRFEASHMHERFLPRKHGGWRPHMSQHAHAVHQHTVEITAPAGAGGPRASAREEARPSSAGSGRVQSSPSNGVRRPSSAQPPLHRTAGPEDNKGRSEDRQGGAFSMSAHGCPLSS